jgi:hypothetical protein
MEFTSTQKYENYKMLLESIKELRRGVKPSDDWEQLHFTFFSKLRAVYPDMSKINLEIEDRDFRKTLFEAEQIAKYLEMYWENNGTIHYNSYLDLLVRIREIAEYFMDDYEITSIMMNMNIA